jgi:hypothetical protein
VKGIKRWMRHLLFRAGRHCTAMAVQTLDNALNYLAAGHWARRRGMDRAPSFPDRLALFRRIAQDVAHQRTLYLEFGVFQGASLRAWSALLRHPESRLHGFDSFQGLPETWTADKPRGHFTTGGVLPQLDDPRVQLFPGWFEDVLPGYRPPDHDRLVISLDADLYSSTRLVLTTLQALIVPGTYLYFDEFCHRQHEMKAFDELLEATSMRFEPVGQSRCWEHAAFRRVP